MKNEQRTGKSQEKTWKRIQLLNAIRFKINIILNYFKNFSEVNDPRNQSYIDYSVKTMLATLYYKCIGGISSMQEMTRQFNDK